MPCGTCSSPILVLELACFFIGCMNAHSHDGLSKSESRADHQLSTVGQPTPGRSPPGDATPPGHTQLIHSGGVSGNKGSDKIVEPDAAMVDQKVSNIKLYLVGTDSSLIGRQDDSKRYLDDIGSSFIKKSTEDISNHKRYLDKIGSSFIKKSVEDDHHLQQLHTKLTKDYKGYIKAMQSDFPNGNTDNSTAFNYIKQYKPSKVQDGIEATYESFDKRYLDGITSSLLKRHLTRNDKYGHHKRYLDDITSSFMGKRHHRINSGKRYLDNIGSSLIKRTSQAHRSETAETIPGKRYLDNVGSSLIKKKENGHQINKKYIDSIGDSLMKKAESDKTNSVSSNNVASSISTLQALDEQGRNIKALPYMKRSDEVTNDAFVVKRDVYRGSKHSKQNHRSKRDITSSLSSDLTSSDTVDQTLEPTNFQTQTFPRTSNKPIDDWAAKLQNDFPELSNAHPHVHDYLNRETSLLESIGKLMTTLNSRQPTQMLTNPHPAADNLHNEADVPQILNSQPDILPVSDDKRYLDYIASNLWLKKRFPDGMSFSSLEKKYMDSIGSSIFRKRYLDSVGSALIKKRYLDSIGSSLVKKRYLDDIGYSLLKRLTETADPANALSDDQNRTKRFNVLTSPQTTKNRSSSIKRYIDSLASGLLHRRSPVSNLHHLRGTAPFGGSIVPTSILEKNRRRRLSSLWKPRPMSMPPQRTLAVSVPSLGAGPAHPHTKPFLQTAFRNYVNDESKDVIANAKVLQQQTFEKEKQFLGSTKYKQKLPAFFTANRSPLTLSPIDVSGNLSLKPFASMVTKPHINPWDNDAFGEPRARKNFFDSLAGGIL